MSNLTKKQSLHLQRLLSSEDFRVYQEMLMQEERLLDQSLQPSENDLALQVQKRNTYREIIHLPAKLLEAYKEAERIAESQGSATHPY